MGFFELLFCGTVIMSTHILEVNNYTAANEMKLEK